jgi:hypothetical protein
LIPLTDGAGPMFIPAMLLEAEVDADVEVEVPLVDEHPAANTTTATHASAAAPRAVERNRAGLCI